MNRTATIIVPTLDRDGHPITSAHAVACDVLARMARMFGGATMTDGLGAYTMDDGSVMFERTAIVTSYTDAAGIEKNRAALGTFARELCLSLQQESIAMVVDGCMTLVRPAKEPEPRVRKEPEPLIRESEASGWGDY